MTDSKIEDLIDQLRTIFETEPPKKALSTIYDRMATWFEITDNIGERRDCLLLRIEREGLIDPAFATVLNQCLHKLAKYYHDEREIATFFYLLTEANIARANGHFDDALNKYQWADRQMASCPANFAAQRIAVLEGCAEVYRLKREFGMAAQQYNHLIELNEQLGNRDNLVEDYCDLANMQLSNAESHCVPALYEEAENSLLQAEIHLNHSSKMQREVLQASIWGMQGRLEIARHRFEHALNWFEKALDSFTIANADMRQGRTLVFIGRLYQMLHCEAEADAYFADAWEILAKYGLKDEQENVSWRAVLANHDLRKNDQLLQKELSRAKSRANLEQELVIHLQVAGYFCEQQKWPEALDAFKKSLLLAWINHFYFEQIVAQLGLAQAYRMLGQFDDARDVLSECGNSLSGQTFREVAELKSHYQSELILTDLSAGRIDIETAITKLQATIHDVEQIYSELTREELRVGFFANLARIYNQLIRFFLKQNNRASELLCTIENARGRSLTQALIKKSRQDTTLLSHMSSDGIQEALARIRQSTKRDEQVVIFELHDLGDQLVIFEIQPDRVQQPIQVHQQYLSEGHELRRQLASLDFVDSTQAYLEKVDRKLENILKTANATLTILKELVDKHKKRGTTQIIFIPHREWHGLPLETIALADHPLDQMPSFTVSRVPNLKTLAYLLGNEPRIPHACHAVALTAGRALPTNALEMQLLQNYFPSNFEKQVANNANALSPAEIARISRNCYVFHISSHGQFDSSFPLRSSIALGGKENAQWMLAEIIQDLQFANAPIIVLSACETGRVSVNEGDDFYGFARAFLLAGASAVISAGWRIHEIPTLLLLNYFYQALQKMSAEPHEPFQAAKALMAATQRLRRLDKQTIRELLSEQMDMAGMQNQQRAEMQQRVEKLFLSCSETNTFDRFSLWAGFTCVGV
ncbi:CHAT domain-containing protein [candidate division KSB1 bacterium]|nr:CHAT domain-containing protein [candidate division KSB1 bacterium]